MLNNIALRVVLALIEPGSREIREGTWTELWLGILFLSSPAGISAYLLIIINNIYLCFLRTAEPEPNFKLLFFLGTG